VPGHGARHAVGASLPHAGGPAKRIAAAPFVAQLTNGRSEPQLRAIDRLGSA
jgi:hypothetical protein